MLLKWLYPGIALALVVFMCSEVRSELIVIGFDDRPTGASQDSGNNIFTLLAMDDIGSNATDQFWIADANPSSGGEFRIGITFSSPVAAGTIINFNGDTLNPVLTDGLGNVITASFQIANPVPPSLSQPGSVYVYGSSHSSGLTSDDPIASFNLAGGTPFSSPANAVDFRGLSQFSGSESLAYTGTQYIDTENFDDFLPLIQDPNNWTNQTTGAYAPPSGVFAVPEPGALGLLLLATGVVASRRKR